MNLRARSKHVSINKQTETACSFLNMYCLWPLVHQARDRRYPVKVPDYFFCLQRVNPASFKGNFGGVFTYKRRFYPEDIAIVAHGAYS